MTRHSLALSLSFLHKVYGLHLKNWIRTRRRCRAARGPALSVEELRLLNVQVQMCSRLLQRRFRSAMLRCNRRAKANCYYVPSVPVTFVAQRPLHALVAFRLPLLDRDPTSSLVPSASCAQEPASARPISLSLFLSHSLSLTNK